jgi:pimeloyl-ACP methyl ester carboxylesterase
MHRRTFSLGWVGPSQTLPVLLIHGYICNSGYWHPCSQVLKRAKVNHFALDLEPMFGSIEAYLPLVQRTVEAICAQTGSEKLIIVGHSMGGLVARAYLREHGSTRIAQVITLGTPHNGTNLATRGPGVNSRQMEWTPKAGGTMSAWLTDLNASENAVTRALITSIFSYHDNIVSPQLSSQLAGAHNIPLVGVGHVELALNPLVQQCLLHEIERVSAQI